MLKGVREGDPHRDTIPLGHGKVEGRGERGTHTGTHYYQAMARWKGRREGREGGPVRDTIHTIRPY